MNADEYGGRMVAEPTLLSFQGPFGRVRMADEVLTVLERALPVAATAQR